MKLTWLASVKTSDDHAPDGNPTCRRLRRSSENVSRLELVHPLKCKLPEEQFSKKMHD